MGSGDRSTLVRICDPAGRPRGTGFVADDRGTVVTSHEAVDGPDHLVLYGTEDHRCRVASDAVTALPELDLALVHTGGPDVLGVDPLPIVLRDRFDAGTYVRLAAHGWREARVLGVAPVTYTVAGRSYRVGAAMELALGTDGSDALRLRGAAVGGPVLDPETGAVIAVLGVDLRSEHGAAGFAVPLAGGGADGPLAALLRRNATTVPGYGRDLNLAGALQLTAMSIGSGGGPGAWPDPVERPVVTQEITAFTAAGQRPEVVLGLVAEPGTGRTTELAALAARRARGNEPALTLWLRGADLLADDTSVADAVARMLGRAGRIVAAAGAGGDMATATPDRVARLAADSGSPLLVLLDGPEEMPPVLAHRLERWTAGTVDWLRGNGARMVVACRPEHWETAGALCPPGALHRPAVPARRLPSAVRLDDLTASQAEQARERYAIPADALAPGHDRHPIAAASYGLVTAPHVTADDDRELLRRSALALLARPADIDLHGAALILLVRDPHTRDRYLPQALRVFVQGDPHLSAAELAVVLPTHRESVIAAFREALTLPGDGAGEVLRSLAGIDAPALALYATGLVRAYVDSHPEGGPQTAAYIDRRLEHGPAARALLLPLVTGLLRDRPAPAAVRGALARVLAAPGTPASGTVRAELLEVLLEFEEGAHRDPIVLEALLCAAATGSARRAPVRTRVLVHRTAMLLVRTPEGAARFDRRLVELARDVPGFAGLITGWLADAPQEWAAVVGPSARRTVETLSTAMTMPMQAAGREHGSLRPA